MGHGKVIISGYYGCGNLGDEAILTALVERLRVRWPELELIVLSGAPAETAKVHRVQAINRWNFFRVARELRSADCLISGGGGLLQDRTSWRSLLYYLGIIGLAQALGRPVFIIGQGLGPLRRRWLQRLAQRRLRRVSYALLRDEASAQLLQEDWGLPSDHLTRGGDLALLWRGQVGAPHALPLPANQIQKPYLVAALKGPQSQQFVRTMAGALDALARVQDLRVVFLALSARGDREAMQTIAQQMEEPSLLLAPQAGELRETLELIAGARFILGMRLHALIFALRTATPFAAISDDPKIDHFLKQAERVSGLRLPHWSLNDIKGSGLDLRSAFAKLVSKREACEALRCGAVRLAAETEVALKDCFDQMDLLIRR
jgi:polysaccharide pyruvyl transferase CsaB